jgi:hypothetical protein
MCVDAALDAAVDVAGFFALVGFAASDRVEDTATPRAAAPALTTVLKRPNIVLHV